MVGLDTRLRRLEGSIWREHAGGDETFTVAICTDPPCYWIDGVEVSADEFRWRAPARGAYTVNIGADDAEP
jgi:hypothetical protein